MCGPQAFARALSAANVTAWVSFFASNAANPLYVSGFGSRRLFSGETRDPPDLRGFVFVESNSPGPLFEAFPGITAATHNSSSTEDSGLQTHGHGAGPPDGVSYSIEFQSGDTNTNVPLWDDGPWWIIQVRTRSYK